MDLLIAGGTRFLGRKVAEQALAAGHRVTLLHRGRSAPGLFAQAEHLIADRDGDLAVFDAAPRRHWDAVIDTSAYAPRQVNTLAAKLRARIGHYQLVSTISVYAATPAEGNGEEAAVVELPDPAVEEVSGATYGGLKVLCERAARAAFARRSDAGSDESDENSASSGSGNDTPVLITRPGLLVGPFDPTGRFTWWVQRLARGGTVLAPGTPDQPVQFIDVRDAAAWMLRQAEARAAGVVNLTGPATPLSLGAWLSRSRDLLAPGAVLQWVDEAFLLRSGVAPWTDLPLWLPREQAGLHRTDIGRALARGLACRPLEDTVRDTAAWAAAAAESSAPAGAAQPLPRRAVGLAAEREQQLLQAWQQAQAA
jgi:2'-hydroxyisoflavone reductase